MRVAAHRAAPAQVQNAPRRALLKASAAGMSTMALTGGTAMVGGWAPIGRISAAEATAPAPPNLPGGIEAYLQVFSNWSGEISTDPLWTVDVTGESQVVALANWAASRDWKLRPVGFRHNWSPLTVADGTTDEKVLLVNTRSGLTGVTGLDRSSVTVRAGTSMDELLTFLDERRRGLAHAPAPGSLTIGGVLAIGGHGSAVPARGENRPSGFSYGSLSNLITSLRAVVWDGWAGRYVAREYYRWDSSIGALLVHLGRAFITEVTMRVGPRQMMRVQSILDVPASELLGNDSRGRTLARYVDQSGRVEVIWFPFTENPWLKVWTVLGNQPPGATRSERPYNYVFADNPPPELPAAVRANPAATPQISNLQFQGVAAGLQATRTADLYGSSADLFRYVLPSTLKVSANGYAILCNRDDVQWVVNTFYRYYPAKLDEYAARGQFPINGPVEIRVCGVDRPSDSGVSFAVDPLLSPTRRRPDRPDLDTVVYLDLLTFPDTPDQASFYTEVEQWLWSTFNSWRATIRVEWSKGWAYTGSGPYTNQDMIDRRIPNSVGSGPFFSPTFSEAVSVLNRLDPYRIYSSPLLDNLLPGRSW